MQDINFSTYKLVASDDGGYDLVIFAKDAQCDTEFGLDFLKKSITEPRQALNDMLEGIKLNSIKIVCAGAVVMSLSTVSFGNTDGAGIISNIFGGNVVTVQAAEPGKAVFVSNVDISMGKYKIVADINPAIANGRILLPLRAVAESLDANVAWNAAERMVTITKEGKTIRLYIDKTTAYINNVPFMLDSAPIIMGSRTLVPVRFIAETLGSKVDWSDSERSVKIDYDKQFTLKYTVAAGDTVAGIASRFNTSVQNIRDWNNLKNDNLFAGQFINVGPPWLVVRASDAGTSAITAYKLPVVMGYTVRDYEAHTSSYDSLRGHGNKVNNISTFTHKVNADGTLTSTFPQGDSLNEANKNGMGTFMLVHNTATSGFDGKLGANVIANTETRARLIDSITSEAVRLGYTGVEIDFEALPASSRNDFSNFLAELKAKLVENNLQLAAAVPAKTVDDPKGWDGAYDYAAIGKSCDRVLIMTYDQHWGSGAAGPVAGIDWVERVVKFTTSRIEPSKVLLGIAAYGYDWRAEGGGGKSITESQVNNLVSKYGGPILWDETAQTPYYRYTDDNGVKREVWFENVYSTQFKLKLAQQYKLGGIGIWRLGLENEQFWSGISQK